MSFTKVCTVDELWEGEMAPFTVNDHEIVLVCADGGEISAFQGVCPHQDIPLVEGKFDGRVVMCRAHQWTFDAVSGDGVNPKDCRLARYPVKVEGETVLVSTEGVAALFAHT